MRPLELALGWNWISWQWWLGASNAVLLVADVASRLATIVEERGLSAPQELVGLARRGDEISLLQEPLWLPILAHYAIWRHVVVVGRHHIVQIELQDWVAFVVDLDGFAPGILQHELLFAIYIGELFADLLYLPDGVSFLQYQRLGEGIRELNGGNVYLERLHILCLPIAKVRLHGIEVPYVDSPTELEVGELQLVLAVLGEGAVEVEVGRCVENMVLRYVVHVLVRENDHYLASVYGVLRVVHPVEKRVPIPVVLLHRDGGAQEPPLDRILV